MVNASIPPNPFFLDISCPDMVLSVGLAIVNPGFNYLLGLETILLAARGGKEIRARTQQRTQGYFLLLARGAALGACVLTRTRARARARTHTHAHIHFISFPQIHTHAHTCMIRGWLGKPRLPRGPAGARPHATRGRPPGARLPRTRGAWHPHPTPVLKTEPTPSARPGRRAL